MRISISLPYARATLLLLLSLPFFPVQARYSRPHSQHRAKRAIKHARIAHPIAPAVAFSEERSLPVRFASTAMLAQELERRMAQLSANASAAYKFAPTTTAPKDNIWAPLSNDEAATVIAYLHKHFNVTKADEAGAWDNIISNVDLVPPNKTEALAYLDGVGSRPARWAKASLIFGATEMPYVQDFAVGPLPLTANATHFSFDYVTTSGKNRIINPFADIEKVYEWLANVTISIGDITQDLLGAANKPDDENPPLVPALQDPQLTEMKPGTNGSEERRFIHWAELYRTVEKGFPFDMLTILPQGLFFKVDVTGREPSKWTIDGWLYNNIFYRDIEEFRNAWRSPDFKKIEPLNLPGKQGSTDRSGRPLKYDERAAPVTLYPEGQRFALDHARQYIEWAGFSFFLGFTRDTGLQIYDIRLNGERIIYHMGLQEAIAHYASAAPTVSNIAYLDSTFGFGAYAYELVDGYDCPHGSAYLNTTYHSDEYSQTRLNSICLFEQDAHLPLQRHSSDNYIEATKNIQLVLRSVSTLGNYDYTFSVIFSMDGSIENKVSASGYIQGAHFAHNDEYGYRIRDGLSGSMHDHVLNFKVDVDVKGTQNTFAKHGSVAVNATYPWFNGTRSTMKLNKTWILNEDEGKLHWPYNGQTQYLVLNKNVTNKYGEHPGYRIMPGVGAGGHHLSFAHSESLKNSMGFAREHIYITKQKDTEVWSAHANNNYDTENPIINFDDFLDGESLDQEDLVLWVNLGMTHIPHTGDLPTTVQTTAQSSFVLLPHNYHLGDPSRRTRQQVRISYGEWQNHTTKVETFGQNSPPNYAYPMPDAYGDLREYQGEVAVRKYPGYDPQHPMTDQSAI